MSVLAEFSIVPVGKGTSISPLVAKVLKIVAESGIPYRANPMGTVLEGDWDTVMRVIRRCHDEALKESGRVLTSVRIDDRKGDEKRMDKKLQSVEQKTGMKLNR